MAVRREPNGRWRAVVKSGRAYVGGRTFDTRREAVDWERRERAALAGGVDVRAGKETVASLLPEWVEHRRSVVAPKTARTDAELLRLVSPALGARSVATVSPPDVDRWLLYLRESEGQGDASVRRYRASLSSFFSWAMDDRRVAVNPVAASRPPRPIVEPVQMRPFTEAELGTLVRAIARRDPVLADVVAIAGWSGLRWAELRAIRVADVQDLPTPALRVVRSQPEGHAVKTPKSGKGRRVPLADVVLPAVRRARESKDPSDLLLTTARGGQLWAGTFRRRVLWSAGAGGRRLHDLRHTAACLWLARGVDPGTVQTWMGHASITTTQRYLHHLGTDADVAGLARLNSGGTYGAHETTEAPSEEGADQ